MSTRRNLGLKVQSLRTSWIVRTGQLRESMYWKHWKKPSKFIDYDKLYHAYAVVFHEFINLCILTMKENEIKDIYVKKNVENILRQKYGY